MIRFILRRLFVSIFILLAALFVVYNLVAISKDPLQDLVESTAPNKAQLIQARVDLLELDVPPPARFFLWLGRLFTGDWGVNIAAQDVGGVIGPAVEQTLLLVTGATVLAIIIGVSVGVATALRQYSGFDYTITFFSFLLYSLPIFFVAVLLKQYVAIGFNDFLADPHLPIGALAFIGVVLGFIFQAVIGGDARQRLMIFGGVAVGSALVLWLMDITDWFRNPGFGIPLMLVLGAVVVAVVASLSVGLRHRRNLLITGGVAALGAVVWYPLQFVLTNRIGWWIVPLVVLGLAVIGWAAGRLLGGNDRRITAGNGFWVGLFVGLLLIVDRVLQVWNNYYTATNGRPIATVGSTNPVFANSDSIWIGMLDLFTHLLLPTIAIMLISIAGYSRYARGSLLEIMNQDYIRTARAKGLPERSVVMRHAMRNAMIPVTTIVAADVGAIVSGAIITEQIFGWVAMGSLFSRSLSSVDLNPLMAYMIVTAALVVIFNLIADILYSVLDPRIRLN
ncbi:MAG: ABC transporter permease [Microbacteriaceae bacterium]|nr:ABC transporter permease [Microbacteriaceae bacterium]